MSAQLKSYQQKRNFDLTNEPRGGTPKKSAARTRRYVVQRHQARNLHYDFRLEIDGVLVSWAVPKGPSLDPAVKRLAVHVEDHPLEYGNFEGDIPRGQYGAGHVDIWDHGKWTSDSNPSLSLAEGHIKFELDGKLQGAWVLLRTGKNGKQWLLRKLDDEHAVPGHDAEQSSKPDVKTKARSKKISQVGPKSVRSRSPMPASITPQLATLIDRPPSGDGWSYEVKYDGYRMLCRMEGKDAQLLSRNGKNWNTRMRGLAQALGGLALGDGWIDGEVVCFDKNGLSHFQALQQALDGATDDLVFVAFDLPFWNGLDLRKLPLSKRQQFLQELLEPLPPDSPVMFTQKLDVSSNTEGKAAWTEACRLSLEGLICKKKDAPYTEGRSTTWLKLKCRPEQEFVVGGYTSPSGSRSNFGALLVGLQDKKQLNYAGRVGTGFTQKTLEDLHQRLKKLERKTNPFSSPPPDGRGRFGRSAGAIHWVSPKLVIEVEYAGWTQDGLLRQASFSGLREDKPASSVTEDIAAAPDTLAAKSSRANVVGGVSVSHPDRIIYTEPDFSKIELLLYYESVHELMLPHLQDRRVALLRCPKGTDTTCFFQKHLSNSPPTGVALDDEQVVIQNTRGLLELAQFGVVEFHTWGSSLPRPEKPDRITLDLDPDPDLPWADVVLAAVLIQRLMQEAGLVPYLKTTGGKGLHLVAPIKPMHSWNTVKAFARAMATYLEKEAPSQFTANVSKARRKGRIFVDYLRNGNGATAIAAFSARARHGAPVSMPIAWDELDSRHDLRAARFNIGNALSHRQDQGQDPWHDYASSRKALRLAFQKELGG